MKAGFVKAPFQFEVREVPLREIKENEVLVDVRACSVCGHDLIMASYGAKEFVQFGHEIAGVVEQVGRLVKNVAVADTLICKSPPMSLYSTASIR